jgi:tetratricopeptide (TPR) repeat protein
MGKCKSYVGCFIVGSICWMVLISSLMQPQNLFASEETLLGAEKSLQNILGDTSGDQIADKTDGVEEVRQQLLSDITTFRLENKALSPEQAAKQWLDLVKRYINLPQKRENTFLRMRQFTYQSVDQLSFMTLLKSLPGPASWKLIASQIKDTPELNGEPSFVRCGIQGIIHYITGDYNEFEAELKEMEMLSENLQAFQKGEVKEYIAVLRNAAYAASLKGGAETLKENFNKTVDAHMHSSNQYNVINIPDLYALLPEAEATSLVGKAVKIPNVVLSVPSGGKTLEFVKVEVMKQLESMDLAQWHLITSPDDIELFEAFRKKFPQNSTKVQKLLGDIFKGRSKWHYDSGLEDPDQAKRKASAFYIAGLLRQDRVEDAVKFTLELDKKERPPKEFRQLKSIHQGKYARNIFTYCRKVLEKDTGINLWTPFLKASIALDETDTLVAIIDSHLKNTKKWNKQHFELLSRRIKANLAVNKVDEGLKDIRTILTVDISKTPSLVLSDHVKSREKAALLLIQLGRALDKTELVTEGMNELLETIEGLSGKVNNDTGYEYAALLQKSVEELIRAKRFSLAEKIVTREIKRKVQLMSGKEVEAIFSFRSSLETEITLLLKTYMSAGRPKDVIYVLDNFPWWLKEDLAEITSRDTHFAAAESLYQLNQIEEAEAIIKNLIRKHPEKDSYYQLLMKISGSDAIPWLQALYERDKFEERPLIWIAFLLKEEGKYAEAEKVIRQALKVDPTDGEQKAGDRVYAYTVLAEILKELGNKKESDFFFNVVKAVRIAEKGDEFQKIGLLERSLEKYGEAQVLFADAYCVQWRMAERLYELGKVEEAKKHYSIAFERMPEQFGQVASFCFGCEGVFNKENSRSIAEEVLLRLEKTTPDRPQVYFLLGQLRQSQNNLTDAYSYYHKAVEIDPEYLDAWEKLIRLQEVLYHTRSQKDEIVLTLLELDPSMNHYHADFSDFSDIAGLWKGLEAVEKFHTPEPKKLFSLDASKKLIEKYKKKAEEMFPKQAQLSDVFFSSLNPPVKRYHALSRNGVIEGLSQLMLITEQFY